MRSLVAWLDHRRVGTLSEADDLWRFDYDPAWIAAPDGFDLSPALARGRGVIVDGASRRPVQWYFDNLLPEEQQRETVLRDAGLRGDDAFALLDHLGAESAGSLVLLAPGRDPLEPGGLQALSDEALSARIRARPRVPLSREAPKRMSVAGAQDKLLVVARDGALFEPRGSEPSTHLLKPDHAGDDYPSSVINEFFTMRLARALGLAVAGVERRYVPEPVNLVERFDRWRDADGRTRRRHIIDACQLLDRSRGFKYAEATLQTLAALVGACRNRASTRLRLFGWLVFNLLAGNHDNHLKNLSFLVGPEGVELAPHYDLLSTGVWHTVAFAAERANWPSLPLAVPLPGATAFSEATRDSVIAAGTALGLTPAICRREIDRMAGAVLARADALIAEVEAANAALPDAARPQLGGELRLLRAIRHVVLPEMVGRLRG